MAMMAHRFEVEDYDRWRAVFDSDQAVVAKAGITNVRIYRGADNPNEAIVWAEVADPAKVRELLESEHVVANMRRAGVTGTPVLSIVS